jgi:hypothetical protein
VPEQIEFKVLLLCHKCIIGTAPSYSRELVSLVTSYTPGRNLRSSDGQLLVQRRARLVSYGDGAFSCAAPKLWNDLPQSARKICCTPAFVRHLKTHLFSRYSGPSAKITDHVSGFWHSKYDNYYHSFEFMGYLLLTLSPTYIMWEWSHSQLVDKLLVHHSTLLVQKTAHTLSASCSAKHEHILQAFRLHGHRYTLYFYAYF